MKAVECNAYLFYEIDDKTEKKIDGGIQGINPEYQTKDAACADIATPVKIVIPPHKSVKQDLWIGFEIPRGYKIVMYPRSSLLIKRGLMQPVSIIDSDFSGQPISVPLHNLTDEEVVIEAGERVAQIECVPAYDCVSWAHKNVVRGQGGFGSTGK